MGVGGGVILARLARLFIAKWIEFPAVHTPLWSIALAFGFCAMLRIIFGIYPAARAAAATPARSATWR